MNYTLKSILTFTMLLCLGVNCFGQFSFPGVNASGFFTLEKVGEKYEMFKIELSDSEIIFRKDRLEIYHKTNERVRSDYIVFKGSDFSDINGANTIQEFTRINENEDMAAVLGSDNVEISTFQQLNIKNFYPNIDLNIVFDQGILEFNFSEPVYDGLNKFDVEYWSSNGIEKLYNNKGVQLNEETKELKLNFSLDGHPIKEKKSTDLFNKIEFAININ